MKSKVHVVPTPVLDAVLPCKRGLVLGSHDYKGMAKLASIQAKEGRLGGGTKPFFKTTMSDIGALGIGLQLYFMLMKYLSITFFLMGCASIPALILHWSGNGVDEKYADPLGLAYFSLGNEGVHDALTGNPKLCAPNTDIDCLWKTIDSPLTKSPEIASWIITFCEVIASGIFLIFIIVYSYKSRHAIERYENENLSPAKYAIYVRGLPKYATEKLILDHFNKLYDPTEPQMQSILWLGCCWGRRHKIKSAKFKFPLNMTKVNNLDHLCGTTHEISAIYIGTWVAEVAISHPTGGLLHTFMSMEKLTKNIETTSQLLLTLQREKAEAEVQGNKVSWMDTRLLRTSELKLQLYEAKLAKRKSKIKSLREYSSENSRKFVKRHTTAEKLVQAVKEMKAKSTKTKSEFNWDACECAFVVFNNMESRRRCLFDYRKSSSWLPRYFQPKELRFEGKYSLIVKPAPEPSNILWENLDMTKRGRFYRRGFTTFLTFLLLLGSTVIISGAQTAQRKFKDKMPPPGLCDVKLPQVFYGNDTFEGELPESGGSIIWELIWMRNKTCSPGPDGEERFHIQYSNQIINDFPDSFPVAGSASYERCINPCVSDTSNRLCNTLPCFDKSMQEIGRVCETYLEYHILYCYCVGELTTGIQQSGFFDGPQELWHKEIPCRVFIADYITKNMFIVLSSSIVIIVNMALKSILNNFASFERHSSESAKASAIAMKMFGAQFLNTAVIILITNFSIGLNSVPIAKEFFQGRFKDFEREWYPLVGIAITMTMLINAIIPQISLSIQLVLTPLLRCLKKRGIRTQEQMNALYAGSSFNVAIRYPLVLNSLVVTMVFSPGSPVLFFIASAAAMLMYTFDKLSIMHLYIVSTTYDAALGSMALDMLPWILVLHLIFACWMFGNPNLMQSPTISVEWLVQTLGIKMDQTADKETMLRAFVDKAASIDFLGKYGFVVKIVRSQVLLIGTLAFVLIIFLLASKIWDQILGPIYTRSIGIFINYIWKIFVNVFSILCCCGRKTDNQIANSNAPEIFTYIPEFTDVFRKTVSETFKEDTSLQFFKLQMGHNHEDSSSQVLVRLWKDDTLSKGIFRKQGTQRLTWEAMQAPIVNYSIDANPKYRLAVKQLIAEHARRLARLNQVKMGNSIKERNVENIIHDTI